MNSYIRTILPVFIVLSIAGCSLPRNNASTPTVSLIPSETPNIEMTVNAALKATEDAKSAMQATIDISVAGTITAIPPQPTPTLMNISYVTEDEVVEMVEQEVDEVMQASTECAEYASTAAADDTITSEELAEMEAAVLLTEEAIEEAMYLAEQYMSLYADLAEETIYLLNELESELAYISQSTAQIDATLDEINTAMQQGLSLAEETISQLETQAAEIQAHTSELQAKADAWKDKAAEERDKRAEFTASIQPDQIAGDKVEALQQLSTYIQEARTSLADGKLSYSELSSLGRLGANASASLRQFGEAGAGVADKLNGLTVNFARGEIPQAMNGLSSLEGNFNSLGSSLKDFSPPSLPKPPLRR